MIIDRIELAARLQQLGKEIAHSGISTGEYPHKKAFRDTLLTLLDADSLVLPDPPPPPPPEMTLDKVMPALRAGGKIRRKAWKPEGHIYINTFKVLTYWDGTNALITPGDFLATDWEIIG